MAEFLTTTGVSHYFEQMIDKAEKWLVFVSPFWKTNPVLRQQLGHKFEKGFPTWLIHGKSEMNTGEDKWWKQFPCVHMGFLENLHAKCYLSEQEAIVTSMNLYDFSQQNNNEMGIVLRKKDDKDLYEQVVKYSGKMIAYSQVTPDAKEKWSKLSVQADPVVRRTGGLLENLHPTPPLGGTRTVARSHPHPRQRSGFCIRCSEQIIPDLDLPYCRQHRESWLQWQNPDYVENHCYACGVPFPTSQRKPLCDRCFSINLKGVDIFQNR